MISVAFKPNRTSSPDRMTFFNLKLYYDFFLGIYFNFLGKNDSTNRKNSDFKKCITFSETNTHRTFAKLFSVPLRFRTELYTNRT